MRIRQACALVIAIFAFVLVTDAQVVWRPVSQEELDDKAPQVEAGADAEALFWEVELDDRKRKKLFYKHYVRVKIYTERGREKFSKFDIQFAKGKLVEDVAARVIKPDGTIVNVNPSEIYERELVRAGKFFISAKSFAIPGLEPGVILEYQYKETFKNDSANFERLWFQRDIPVRRIVYRVRPYEQQQLYADWHNMGQRNFVDTEDGFLMASEVNVPALREEPNMPPDNEVRRWALVRYSNVFSWFNFARGNSAGLTEILKPDKEITEKAYDIVGDAANDDARIKALYDFVQTKLRNATYDPTVTDEQRQKLENKKVTDTLRRGIGTSTDLDLLFAALAKALGFKVNVVFAGDRSESFADPETYNNPQLIHWTGIMIDRKPEPLFCNPGTPFMPFGQIDWYEEAVNSLIVGENNFRWARIRLSPPEKNLSKRTAKLKLTDDGTLEGFVRVEHTGHRATSLRREWWLKSPEEREKAIIANVKARLGTAEVSMFSFENFSDPNRPYTYSYNIRVPNYASRTGKRMFLQPNFFEYGLPPRFASSDRKYGVYFEFGWSENDSVEIQLPPSMVPDSLSEPNVINEASDLGNLKNTYIYNSQSNSLTAERKFYFGTKGRLNFPVAAYPPIKKLFDFFNTADTHSISLKTKQ